MGVPQVRGISVAEFLCSVTLRVTLNVTELTVTVGGGWDWFGIVLGYVLLREQQGSKIKQSLDSS